jgi:hypothetical protein
MSTTAALVLSEGRKTVTLNASSQAERSSTFIRPIPIRPHALTELCEGTHGITGRRRPIDTIQHMFGRDRLLRHHGAER